MRPVYFSGSKQVTCVLVCQVTLVSMVVFTRDITSRCVLVGGKYGPLCPRPLCAKIHVVPSRCVLVGGKYGPLCSGPLCAKLQPFVWASLLNYTNGGGVSDRDGSELS